MEKQKILVIGGNGFIGREICRLALSQGHKVTSISRSGCLQNDEPWTDGVCWVQANILEPQKWRTHLEGCDAVIHSVGIIVEKTEIGVTFQRINGDSAIIAADEAQKAKVNKFVFISAKAAPPFVPKDFLTAKRRAEEAIQKKYARSAILRPSLVYGPGRTHSVVLAKVLDFATNIPVLGKSIYESRPLQVEVVAMAALRAALEPRIEGILNIETIDQLGLPRAGEFVGELVKDAT